MPDYEKLYYLLFNEISDVIARLQDCLLYTSSRFETCGMSADSISGFSASAAPHPSTPLDGELLDKSNINI